MAQLPTPGGGQNQTLLELIFALKGLAQTVEFYHNDLTRRLEDEGKSRAREIEQLRSALGKNQQALGVLPITISGRLEKLLEGLDEKITSELENVSEAVSEVRQKLWQYMKVTERAISQTDGTVEEPHDEKAEITGKMEVTKDGNVRVELHSRVLKKIWMAILILSAGGGVYGIKQAISILMGG